MSIHIITGPMYSSKTARLIKIARSLNGNALVIGHKLDDRYVVDKTDAETFITSHDGEKYPAEKYAKLISIPAKKISRVSHILIDEAQFFPDLMEFCFWRLALVSGLWMPVQQRIL